MGKKNALINAGKAICSVALAMGISSVNTACAGWFHQPKSPVGMEKFKK